MPKPRSNLIITLVILLLVVVAGAIAVLWFLPPSQPLDSSLPLKPTATPLAGGENAVTPAGAFNLKLFNRSQYQGLHLQLIGAGSLPVEPPAATGKANPFL